MQNRMGLTSARTDAATLAALAVVDGYTEKIDDLATDGLLGTSNSLAYRVHEIEKHFHGPGYWWGAVAVPDETNAIDANVDTPFVAISGNDTWGTAIPILGTGDLPTAAADVRYDAHLVLVVDTEDTTPYRLRFIYGSGTSAEAIIALQFSEIMFIATAGPFDSGIPAQIQMPRGTVGEKLWCQVWNATNLSEVDFFYGCHGYAG